MQQNTRFRKAVTANAIKAKHSRLRPFSLFSAANNVSLYQNDSYNAVQNACSMLHGMRFARDKNQTKAALTISFIHQTESAQLQGLMYLQVNFLPHHVLAYASKQTPAILAERVSKRFVSISVCYFTCLRIYKCGLLSPHSM